MLSSTIQNWFGILAGSLQNLWLQLVSFVPSLMGAIVVFVVGLVVSVFLEKAVERIVYYLGIDNWLRKAGLEIYLNRANLELNSGYFLGRLVYWFILLGFVLAASDILGFVVLSAFIAEVLLYIPNVIVAGLILMAALVAANFVKGLAKVSVMGARLHKGKFLGSLVWWVVFIFGLLVSLSQLGIASDIIETVVTGVIVMLALAGGLAFGLGGKDAAAGVINRMKSDWEHQ